MTYEHSQHPSHRSVSKHTPLSWETYQPMYGRPWQVGDRRLLLYPLKELVHAFQIANIPRTQQQLIKWEIDGILPETPFKIGRQRFYTENQIRTIVDIALETGLRPRIHVGKTSFKEQVHHELERIVAFEIGEPIINASSVSPS